MKTIISNILVAVSQLLLVLVSVGLGIESVWVWVNRVSPCWWWSAPLGLLVSVSVLGALGYVSILWMRGQMVK